MSETHWLDEYVTENGYVPTDCNGTTVWSKPTPKPMTRSRTRCRECFRQIMDCTCDDMWNEILDGDVNAY